MGRPNIIFFFSDQQRWDTVGAYGQDLAVTEHLDRMAAEGVTFNHAFTCQPACGPARACLQTGKYATETRGAAECNDGTVRGIHEEFPDDRNQLRQLAGTRGPHRGDA